MTGVSGTGLVATGTVYSNGKAVLVWIGEKVSVAVYDSLDMLREIHGHDGKTTIEWYDDAPQFEDGAVRAFIEDVAKTLAERNGHEQSAFWDDAQATVVAMLHTMDELATGFCENGAAYYMLAKQAADEKHPKEATE